MSTDTHTTALGSAIGTLLVALVSFGIGWGCCIIFAAHEKAAGPAADQAPAPTIPAVESAKAVMADINPPETFVGHVEAMEDVDLRVQVDGYLTAVNFKEGSFVKEGDLLFSIDDEMYQARVAQRKAELERAKAELERAELYFKRLSAADKRSFAQTEMDTAQANVLQAKAAISQAEANLSQVEIDLKHTKIFAPISGKIGQSLVKKGDYVAPSMGSLARIVQVDPIRVVFSVTDREYTLMAEAAKREGEMPAIRARLRLASGSTYEEEGTLDFYSNEVNRDTPTIAIRYSFPNKDALLVPNAYVNMIIDRADAPKQLAVPHLAVMTNSDGAFVYVIGKDGIVEHRPIKIGRSFLGKVAVLEGLEEGEEVVIDVLKATPKQPVTVVKHEAAQ